MFCLLIFDIIIKLNNKINKEISNKMIIKHQIKYLNNKQFIKIPREKPLKYNTMGKIKKIKNEFLLR